MKNYKVYFLIIVVFFAGTLLLLRVDRQCGMLYAREDTISVTLQLFIENITDLH